jgi:glycosyltransferase involved in cell wall biosynthesis
VIRVLLISNMYAYPGNWDRLDELGRHVELEVITPSRWATDRELHPVAAVPEHQGGTWRHHPLPTFTQGNPFRYMYRPARLIRALRSFRPDVVHVEQEPESLSLLQLSLLKPMFDYRLVFVAWENINPLRLGAAFRYVNFRAADGAIFGNEAAFDRAGRHGYRGKSAIIPAYGFEIADRPSRRRPNGPFSVGYAGRLVPEKGIQVLVDAVHALPDVELVIAGDGPLAGQLHDDAQIRLLGNMERTAMADFWEQIDVLAVPSLTTRKWAEQFGRVLVEAMARGVPAIGSSSGAIPEVMGDAGVIVPEGDPRGLAQAIDRLRQDPGLRADLSERGYERLTKVYHHDVVTRRTVEFYQDLLSDSGGHEARGSSGRRAEREA